PAVETAPGQSAPYPSAPSLPAESVPAAPAREEPAPLDEAHDDAEETSGSFELPGGLGGPEQWTSPEGLSSALQTLLLLTVVSLASALWMMTTCFVRIAIVLGL